MKGSNSSRLAPMPLISRSGGLLSSPCCMVTKTGVLPLTLIVAFVMLGWVCISTSYSYTYIPGASTRGVYVLLPMDDVDTFWEPERASSQAFQSSHQLPLCLTAPASQDCPSAGCSALVKKIAFGLPGGLRMLWM